MTGGEGAGGGVLSIIDALLTRHQEIKNSLVELKSTSIKQEFLNLFLEYNSIRDTYNQQRLNLISVNFKVYLSDFEKRIVLQNSLDKYNKAVNQFLQTVKSVQEEDSNKYKKLYDAQNKLNHELVKIYNEVDQIIYNKLKGLEAKGQLPKGFITKYNQEVLAKSQSMTGY
jgi:hypothetical protein